jgi:hypothetical protein
MDFNKKVLVKNNANCNCAFKAINTAQDIVISPLAKTPLTVAEIVAQAYAGNKLFVGIDGKGNHANFFIEDEETRIECGFENPAVSQKQEVVDKQAILDMFSIKTLTAFKKALPNVIKTDAEKRLLKSLIDSGEVNDLNKAKAASEYIGIKLL